MVRLLVLALVSLAPSDPHTTLHHNVIADLADLLKSMVVDNRDRPGEYSTQSFLFILAPISKEKCETGTQTEREGGSPKHDV